MKKATLRKIIISALSIIMVITIFSACAEHKKAAQKADAVYGTLLLSVNPEIKIEYDENGVVISVKGVNKDGIGLITDDTAYIGKNCDEAVKELVSKIYDAGYFVEEVKGKTKNIVIKLENGSAYPESDFLDKIKKAVNVEVGILGLDSSPVTVEEGDYDEYGRISVEKAKEIALTQAGITREDATFVERDYDSEDDIYEIEFNSNGVEYELEVNASNGKVMEADLELNDDWQNNPVEDKTSQAEPSVDSAPVISEKIGVESAKAIALEYAGVTTPDYIRCDDSDDDDDYDIEFIANGIEYDVEVNAYTGKVTDFDKDTEEYVPVSESVPEILPETEPATKPDTVRITEAEAKEIALKYAGIDDPDYILCEADDDEYEIEFKYAGIEYDAEINAYSGEVTDFDKDTDDDD